MFTSNASVLTANEVINGTGSEEKEVMFKTMSDLRAKNKKIGHNFFARDTMAFWDSKVESGLYSGTFFITSEKNAINGKPREFTIRQALKTGAIVTVGRGREYSTLESAKDAVRVLARAFKVVGKKKG